MVSTGGTHLIGLFVFFLTLNTIVVGLRLYVRLWLKKSAFGWDDVFMILTYTGLVLFVTSASMAIHYGVLNYHLSPRSITEAERWTAIMNVVCYVTSGTVKISVALVIYRLLDYRPVLRAMITADIILCFLWTFASTLVLSLGCTGTHVSPYRFDDNVCHNTFYAQEASYIFFNAFHVVFPISIVWNVQIKGGQKASVIILFSLGLLSTIAAVLKLAVIVEVFHIPATSRYQDLWERAVTWAATEHGLSLFTAAILALRPLARPLMSPISKGWTSLSGSVSQLYSSSRRDSGVSRPTSAGGTSLGPMTPGRKFSWATAWAGTGKRLSTSTLTGGHATPRLYLTRVSETEHRLMPYRSSDPTGGTGKQWNWTNQWPTEVRAPPFVPAVQTPRSGPATPATIVPPSSLAVDAPAANASNALLRTTSYEWSPSPSSEETISAAINKSIGGASASAGGVTQGSGGNLGVNVSNGGVSGRATQRNTPDYFTCVVEANERNITVQEYLRTLGVSSRLDRDSPESMDTIEAANMGPGTGTGGRNWFEGRRLSHMLL